MVSTLIATLLLAQAATGTTANYSTTTVMEFASSTAVAMGLNKDHFLGTIKCESQFQWDAKGDDGHSVGVVQIDGDYHPEVLYTQMLNPYWSILWMASEWRKGHASEWSCWKILYSKRATA